MSVSSPSAQYTEAMPRWSRLRDAIAGVDALRQRCMQAFYATRANTDRAVYSYLPPLSGQDVQGYTSYLSRASYFSAPDRTLNALAGMIFAKPPVIELPPAIQPFEEDITLSGVSLREFAQRLVVEELAVTRVGVLVDFPQVSTEGMTQAQAESANLRPFLAMYKAESIIAWSVGNVGGAQRLTSVRLHEMAQEPGEREFETVDVEQYRVLDLFEGAYRQRIYRKAASGDWVVVDERFPLMRGRPMTYIPFAIVGGYDVRKPLLLDLADLALAQFKNAADYEHGLHWAGIPTPFATGVQSGDGTVFRIGGDTAWMLPMPDSKVGFLEFSGQGLQPLFDAIKDKRDQMAAMGARFLRDEKSGVEAAETVNMRTASERSILAAVANDVSETLEQCLNWLAEWAGAPQTCRIQLNTNFYASRMKPAELKELVAAWQAGAVPTVVLAENLKQGEITSLEPQEYADSLDSQGPSIDTPAPAATTSVGMLDSLRQRLGL